MENHGSPIWKYFCKYCKYGIPLSLTYGSIDSLRKFRTTTRTAGVTNPDDETLKIKTASNFIKHAVECKNRPGEQSYEAYQEVMERAQSGLPPLPTSSKPTPLEAQQGALGAFIQRGRDNPAKAVTQRGYRQHLTEAIVEDDHPFSLVEGGGTLRLIQYLSPLNVQAKVSHQTVRRDIGVLHSALKKKLMILLKVLFTFISPF